MKGAEVETLPEPDEKDWRKSLATLTNPVPSSGDRCLDDWRTVTNANIYNRNLFEVDLLQEVAGSPLQDLIETTDCTAKVTKKTIRNLGDSCSVSVGKTLKVKLKKLTSDIEIVAIAAIEY